MKEMEKRSKKKKSLSELSNSIRHASISGKQTDRERCERDKTWTEGFQRL